MDKYSGENETLNNLFIGLEIMQLLLYAVCIYLIMAEEKYLYLIVIWLEDVILEAPMVLISFHLTKQTDLPLSAILVVAGGVLSLLVAIEETCS